MSKKNDANVDEDTRMTFTTMTVKERMNLWRQRDVDNKDQLQPNPRIKIPTYSPTVDRGQRKRLSVSVSCFRSSFNQSSTNSEDLKSINQLKLLPPILPSIVSTPPNLSPNSRKSQQISASKQTAQIPCDIMEVRGVTVSFLHSFVEKCGGRASLVGKTTEEVCALFIYPQCLKSGQSLCDIYNDDAGVRTTSWFVSHSVLGLFLDLVDSLCDTLAEMKCSDDALWIDLFSIPQLGQSTSNLLISNEWSKKVLPKVMRATGSRVLGVIAPWDNPSILTCLDCLYELFLCYQLKGRFQGATTANERTLLLQSVVKDQDIFFSVLNAVSSEQASGGSELETIALRTLVRSCVPATTSSSSYQSLNAVAYHLLDSWLEQLLLSQCRPEQAHSSADRLSYHITLAAIYESKERPAEAENIYKTCLSDCDAMQNDSSIHSIRVVALGRLASLLQVQDRGQEARSLLERCLQLQRKLKGFDHVETLATATTLAMLLDAEGQYDEAEALYTYVLDAQTQKLGATHTATLGTMNDLAMLQESRGDNERALVTYQRCFAISQSVLGLDHQDTLTTMTNLAGLHEVMGQTELAERLYVASIEASKRTLGETHTDTLSRIQGLAALYFSTEKLEQAETLFLTCYEGRKIELGPTHAATLKTANNLALLYESLGQSSKAETYFDVCLESQRASLGLVHPTTLDTARNLALCLNNQGKHKDAELLLMQVFESRRNSSGPEYSVDTLETLYDLAECVYAQGEFARSEKYFTMYNDQIKSTKTL